MCRENTSYPKHMLHAVTVLLLVAGLWGSLAHIAEADHGGQEELCSLCVVFYAGLISAPIIVVINRAITYWLTSYLGSDFHLLQHLPATGRSPPLL